MHLLPGLLSGNLKKQQDYQKIKKAKSRTPGESWGWEGGSPPADHWQQVLFSDGRDPATIAEPSRNPCGNIVEPSWNHSGPLENARFPDGCDAETIVEATRNPCGPIAEPSGNHSDPPQNVRCSDGVGSGTIVGPSRNPCGTIVEPSRNHPDPSQNVWSSDGGGSGTIAEPSWNHPDSPQNIRPQADSAPQTLIYYNTN